MKKFTKKWQLIIYAFAGFGINMLNLVVGSYLTDALMTEGFDKNVENWTYLNVTLVSAGVWSILVTLAKVLDGVIDIPLAGFTDNLKCRYGRRRPAILLGLIPLIICFGLFLVPLTKGESIGNTIWFGILLCLFYTFYTLVMVTYYATFSEVTQNDGDRMKLSSYKSVFDVIYFVLGYALIPILVVNMNIRTIALIFMPLALTMLIPLIMIKEKSTKKTEELEEVKAENNEIDDKEIKQVGTLQSLKNVITNKNFMIWLIIYAALQFGLQLFLGGNNVYYSGTMELEGGQITILMACAFAPIPFTLIIYNKLVKRFGFKVGYIYSLTAFILAMGLMAFLNPKIIPSESTRLILGAVAAVISSFGIGAFFSVGYSIPSILADMETKEKGISNSAMFFAIQGLASGLAAALSTGILWINLKNHGLSWTMAIFVAGACFISLLLALFLPNNLRNLGQVEENTKEEKKNIFDENSIDE